MAINWRKAKVTGLSIAFEGIRGWGGTNFERYLIQADKSKLKRGTRVKVCARWSGDE